MNLKGLHILLTYTCNYQCDHCFVWGSPDQTGTFDWQHLQDVLYQASEVGTIEEIYFEGGEPFLYYPLLLKGVRLAAELGFSVGIVSNGYWAESEEDARLWLEPLARAGLHSIDVSSDCFHGTDEISPESERVLAMAEDLDITTSRITVEQPAGQRPAGDWTPGEPISGGGIMYRGRAAEVLAPSQPGQYWMHFNRCLYENLEEPGRMHLDPLGNLHVCQGIVIGNLFDRPLAQILEEYDPGRHPIIQPLVEGGPTTLALRYLHGGGRFYVDACHLCYMTRLTLRDKFPEMLGPDQMYGMARSVEKPERRPEIHENGAALAA